MGIDRTIGEPVRGVLHSTDASSGVAIPIFNEGETGTARTMTATEKLTITHVHFITVAGGDAHVFIGADATLTSGEEAGRGTFAVSGGLATDTLLTGEQGHTPFCIAPAGVVDVVFHGYITEPNTAGVRPSWKESQVPGA